MKKAWSIQSTILLISTIIAFALTLYIGGFDSNSYEFYINTLFVNLTFIGDAYFAFGLIIFMWFYFKRKREAIKLLSVLIITLSITQVIKTIYGGMPFQLYFESGVLQYTKNALGNNNSISSHAAIAFSLACFFTFSTQKFFLKALCICTACLVCFTRFVLANDSIMSFFIALVPSLFSLLYLKRLKYKKIFQRSYFYNHTKISNQKGARQLA